MSRRWHELSHSAPLLARVPAFLPRLRMFAMPSAADAWRDWSSFAAWMRRHGAKVGSLSLVLAPTDRTLGAGDRRRLCRLIWTCLEPCQAAGAVLRELSVTLPPGPLALPASLSRLGALHTLDVGSVGGRLGPVAALQGLHRWAGGLGGCLWGQAACCGAHTTAVSTPCPSSANPPTHTCVQPSLLRTPPLLAHSLTLTHLHATEAAHLPRGLTALKLGVREGVGLPACGVRALLACLTCHACDDALAAGCCAAAALEALPTILGAPATLAVHVPSCMCPAATLVPC